MTTFNRRRFLALASAGLAMPALGGRAFADVWPKDKAIHAIVPFSGGSTIDVVGRIVLDPVSKQLGQTIIVDNHGGAGGSIGSATVAKADPDGYTLLVNASAHSAAPAAYPHLSYDPSKDFAGVAIFGSVPNVLLVAPSKGIKSVKELVDRAKAGQMTFASAGVGSATHWAAERFLLSAGIKATHVPFRGGPEALTEVMTGRVDFCFIGVSSSIAFIKNGQLLPLAVSTTKRTLALPDVPTTIEFGLCRLRLHVLDRHARAGEDAAADRRAAACRSAKGARTARGAGQARAAGCRADAAHPVRNGCDDREGDRRQHCAREGRRAEVQLNRRI